jgi:hypothetical protein
MQSGIMYLGIALLPDVPANSQSPISQNKKKKGTK